VAHELSDWKAPDCTLSVRREDFSTRESFSQEINQVEGEGGALNAGYGEMEAAIRIACSLTEAGLKVNRDFRFKTSRGGQIVFDFNNRSSKAIAERALGPVCLPVGSLPRKP